MRTVLTYVPSWSWPLNEEERTTGFKSLEIMLCIQINYIRFLVALLCLVMSSEVQVSRILNNWTRMKRVIITFYTRHLYDFLIASLLRFTWW
jgi:hypothetical protein